jgi:hypothetical protein
MDSFSDPFNLMIALCDFRIYACEFNLDLKLDQLNTLNEGGILTFALCKKTIRGVFQSKQNPRIIHIYKLNVFKLLKTVLLKEQPSSLFIYWPAIVTTYKSDNNYWFVNGDMELKKPMEGNLANDLQSSLVYGKSGPVVGIIREPKQESSSVSKTKVPVEPDPEYLLLNENKGYIIQFINNEFSKSKHRDIFKPKLEFQDPPAALIIDEPYLVVLVASVTEVHNVFSEKFEESHPFSGNGFCFDKHYIFAYTDNKLHCLIPLPIEKRVKKMIDDGHVDGAIRLFTNAKKYQNKEDIFTYAGDHLFKKLQFEAAFQKYHIGTKDSSLPKKLIRQYPR